MKTPKVILSLLITAVLLCNLGCAWPDDKSKEAARLNKERAMKELLSGVKVSKNLEYANARGKPLLLDVFVPEDAKEKLPLIVWIHGGGWSSGNKENCPALLFLKKGYAVASINYRLSQEAVFPAQIQDCKAAVRFLRAKAPEYNVDPERIGVWGGSAGGHLVALLGVTDGVMELEGDGGNPGVSSRVQAVCDFFGPTDFIVIKEAKMSGDPKAEQKLKDFRLADDNNVVTKLLGGPVEQKKELAEQASPIHYLKNVTADRKNFPPFLIMHGDEDPIVPVEQSITFHDALKTAGLDSSLRVYKGAKHGGLGGDSMKVVGDFFNKNLKR
jgi:acetyl esterase/lipase